VISPHPLDRLVEQDTLVEMLALLEPEELLIAFLRLEALSDDQIGTLLDIDRRTVSRRMEQACQRIVEAMPELAPVLRDRRHPPLQRRKPLEGGWICPSLGIEPDLWIDGPQQGAEKGEPSSDDSPSFAMPDQIARAGYRPPGKCR
jgi:hypothetical protein